MSLHRCPLFLTILLPDNRLLHVRLNGYNLATEVNQNIDKFLEEARKDLPKGVELTQMMSSNDFLFASIHELPLPPCIYPPVGEVVYL